ncbi:hypothetical protein FHETE_8781 [Fusarium heterosporum]|uniref:Uncharacterized protein n=1 Tax=Fusarium heterosporum TaxID=42747 RepID=A0A8H5SVM2_FUSHE|nr:hypothetical protein FHETE_8781 [Fusarium heterosporum]
MVYGRYSLRRGPLTKQVAWFFTWTALAHPEPPTSDLETASVPAPWGALAANIKKPSNSPADTGCYRLQKFEGFPIGMGWNGFQIPDDPVCRSASVEPWTCDRKHGTADGCDTAHGEFGLISDLRPVLGVQHILLLISGLPAYVSEIYVKEDFRVDERSI